MLLSFVELLHFLSNRTKTPTNIGMNGEISDRAHTSFK